MSENLKRSNPDFSKYDSMSIGELEEILRADAQGPERDDSDVDEILYVMEVLAKKRRQNGIAGKTALEAYQEFQQHYLPMAEEKSKRRRKSNVIPFRRIATIAASLVLVFTLATSANAFSFKDIWNAVAKWVGETFSFSTGVESSEPRAESELAYTTIEEALLENRQYVSVPHWIPERFILTDIIVDITPIQEVYLAVYTHEDDMLKISVKSFISDRAEQIEFSEEFVEIYNTCGKDYYLLQNNDLTQAVWIADTCECYIAGNLSIDELKLMIDSI